MNHALLERKSGINFQYVANFAKQSFLYAKNSLNMWYTTYYLFLWPIETKVSKESIFPYHHTCYLKRMVYCLSTGSN